MPTLAIIEGVTAWDYAIVLIALSAPTVLLVLVAMLRGYSFKFWRGGDEPPGPDVSPHGQDPGPGQG